MGLLIGTLLLNSIALGAGPPPTPSANRPFTDADGSSTHRFALSRDGSRLAFGSWVMWDVQTGKRLHTVETYGGNAMAFSPDGMYFAVGGDYSQFLVYDARTGKKHWDLTLIGHGDTVLDQMAFTPCGRFLVSSSGWNGMLRVWDVRGKKPVALFCFTSTAKSLNGWREYIRAWRTLAGDTPPDGVKSFVAFEEPIEWLRKFDIHPDGKTLAVATGTSEIWFLELTSGKIIKKFRTALASTHSLRFSEDGKTLAVGGGSGDYPEWGKWGKCRIEIRDLQTGKSARLFKGHFATVSHVAFSPDGKLLASGGIVDGVRVWDVATGRHLYSLHQKEHVRADWIFTDGTRMAGVAFLPGSQTLLTLPCDPSAVHFWDATTGKPVTLLPPPRPLP